MKLQQYNSIQVLFRFGITKSYDTIPYINCTNKNHCDKIKVINVICMGRREYEKI